MPLSEQSCKSCRWFKKFRKDFEFGQCTWPAPFWVHEFQNGRIERPDLNENEGTTCAAWEEKPNGE